MFVEQPLASPGSAKYSIFYNLVFDLLLFEVHLKRMHPKKVIKSDFIDKFINIADGACAGK